MKNIALALLLLMCTLTLHAQDEPVDLTGTQVPEFQLTDRSGNVISSATTKGKIVVLNFWFVGCKPCLEEIPELNDVYDTYADNPEIVFVSISIDKLRKVEKNLDEYNIDYPIVADGAETSALFKVEGFPTNMVIDKEGNYYFRFAGGFSGIGTLLSKYIQKALDI